MGRVAILTGAGVLSQAVGFVFRVLLTRQAGAEVLGLYQLILPLYGVVLAFSSVGLSAAVSNLSAWYQALGQRRVIEQVRGEAVRLFFLLALGPGLVLFLGSDGVSVYGLGDARTQMGLILLVPCLMLTGVENLQKHYFYGIGRGTVPALTDLMERTLRAGVILLLLDRAGRVTAEQAVGLIVLGMTLCEILSALTQTALFRWSQGPKGQLSGERVPQGVIRRKLIHIAGPLGLSALLGETLGAVTALILPRLLVLGGMEQGEAVSAYGVTFGMALPMLLLPTAFLSALGTLLMPKLTHDLALGQWEAIRDRVRRSVGAANLVLIPALALLTVLGPALGGVLYGEPTVGDHLLYLALGVLFSCWQTLFSGVLSSIDRQGQAAGIALLCDGVQLILTLLTVPRWGMGGYAAGYALTALLGAVLTWRTVSQHIGLTLPGFSWFTAPVLAAALAASCGQLMETVLCHASCSRLAAALGGLIFGGLLYLAALQAMGAIGAPCHSHENSIQ